MLIRSDVMDFWYERVGRYLFPKENSDGSAGQCLSCGRVFNGGKKGLCPPCASFAETSPVLGAKGNTRIMNYHYFLVLEDGAFISGMKDKKKQGSLSDTPLEFLETDFDEMLFNLLTAPPVGRFLFFKGSKNIGKMRDGLRLNYPGSDELVWSDNGAVFRISRSVFMDFYRIATSESEEVLRKFLKFSMKLNSPGNLEIVPDPEIDGLLFLLPGDPETRKFSIKMAWEFLKTKKEIQ